MVMADYRFKNDLDYMPSNRLKICHSECPHCAYDRRFPGFEAGGWMQQDNNGPIVSCPMCNPDGKIIDRQ